MAKTRKLSLERKEFINSLLNHYDSKDAQVVPETLHTNLKVLHKIIYTLTLLGNNCFFVFRFFS